MMSKQIMNVDNGESVLRIFKYDNKALREALENYSNPSYVPVDPVYQHDNIEVYHNGIGYILKCDNNEIYQSTNLCYIIAEIEQLIDQ